MAVKQDDCIQVWVCENSASAKFFSCQSIVLSDSRGTLISNHGTDGTHNKGSEFGVGVSRAKKLSVQIAGG